MEGSGYEIVIKVRIDEDTRKRAVFREAVVDLQCQEKLRANKVDSRCMTFYLEKVEACN